MEYNFWKEVFKRWVGAMIILFILSLIWPATFDVSLGSWIGVAVFAALFEWAWPSDKR